MRHLSRKQKNMLRKHVKATYGDKWEEKPFCFNACNDLPDDVYWKISNVMPFECFDTHVENFVDDIETIADCKVI